MTKPHDDPQRRWLEGVEAASDRWASRESEITVDQWRNAMTAHAGRIGGHRPPRWHRRARTRLRWYLRDLCRALAGKADR